HLHTGNLRAVRLEGTSAPGAYPPGACAGASARFRGNLLLVFREKPTVISREIVAGKQKPTFISRRIVLGPPDRVWPVEPCRARRIVPGPPNCPAPTELDCTR